MNSIKSLSVLTLLAIVGLFLYWKINEKEVELPPEAVDLAFGVPEVELSDDSRFGEATAYDGGGGTATSRTTAPAWASPVPALDSGAQPLAETPATYDSFNAAQPSFSGDTLSSPSGPPSDVTPNTAATPPPGAIPNIAPNNGDQIVMAGRVYDDSLTTAPVAPATPEVEIPQSVAASIPVTPTVGANPPVDTNIVPSAVQTVTPLTVARQAADAQLAQGNYAEALRILTNYHGDPALSLAEQQEVATLVSQLAGTVIYSTQHQIETPYIVQPGETLDVIAAKYGVPTALLAKINGIADPRNLAPGTELKVVRGPFSAVVDLTRRELTLMLGGSYAGCFNIGVGIDQPNMEGTWSVATKEANPTYQAGYQQIVGGDSINPLGDRMLVLQSPDENVAPIGIHGSPATSGLDDPRGFIRLSSADAADVFDILSVGSRVTVRR